MGTYRLVVPVLLGLALVGLAQVLDSPERKRFVGSALGFQLLPILAGLVGCNLSNGNLNGLLLLVLLQLPLVILSAVVYARIVEFGKLFFALVGLLVGGVNIWIMLLGAACNFRGFF